MNILDRVPQGVDQSLADELDRLAVVIAGLARRIARAGIDENLGGAAGTNSDGDTQKALDVIADAAFMDALKGSAVKHYASEEQDDVVTLNEAGTLALAIDPLDFNKCLAAAEQRGWTITQILNTHEHGDHTGGNKGMVKATGAKVIAHSNAKNRIPNMDRGVGAGTDDCPGNDAGEVLHGEEVILLIPTQATLFLVTQDLAGLAVGRHAPEAGGGGEPRLALRAHDVLVIRCCSIDNIHVLLHSLSDNFIAL